ncbi:hypothetical protein ACVWXN_006390 [Bradyrhizobium sp. i1.4.4]
MHAISMVPGRLSVPMRSRPTSIATWVVSSSRNMYIRASFSYTAIAGSNDPSSITSTLDEPLEAALRDAWLSGALSATAATTMNMAAYGRIEVSVNLFDQSCATAACLPSAYFKIIGL